MGTTAEKLAYLKETKNQIKQALETPSNVMRDYANWIKKYVDNQPTQVVTDGICTNALDVPLFSMSVDGNSEQQAYSGKNWFNKSEINNTNGTVNTEITSVYTSNIQLPMTFSSYIYTSTTSLTNTNVRAEVLDENGTSLGFYQGNVITKSGDRSFVVVPAVENAYKVKIGVRIQDGGYTEKSQLEKGTEATDYEPYVGGQPSPSPDYPQDIKVIKGFEEGNQYGLPHGCIGLEQSGKNLLDISEKNVSTTNVTPIMNFDNQKVTITTTGSSGIWFYVPCEANKTYKITYDFIGTITNIRAYKKDKSTFITGSGTDTPSTQKSLNVTTNEDGFYFRLWVVNTTIKLTKAQVSEDDTYEPYHEPKLIPINLNGNSISKVGDVKDLLKIYRNGDVEIEKKIEKVVLNGTENWKGATDFYTSILASLISECPGSTEVLGLSNAFLVNGYNYRKENNLYFHPNKNLMLRNPEHKYYDTLAEWKSYLSEQYANGTPVYVDYQLATPETIKLPSIEPIELWEGTNNFKLITNLDTTFEMEYVVNKDYLETQNLLNAVEGENI